MHDEKVIGVDEEPQPRISGHGERRGERWRGRALHLAIVVAVLLALYYPVGMVLIHKVNDDPDFTVEAGEGQSHAVAVAAALIERETDINRWTANDPFFLPGAALDNMPNFQLGIMYALSRFAIEMSDQIGRVRGSSQVDEDLDNAAGKLKYSGTTWIFNFPEHYLPVTTSEQYYREGRRSLVRYNERLARGEAMFERRADNLQATLERITADMGSASATIDHHIDRGSWFIDFDADDIFYQTKGRLYAYYLLLDGFRDDFAKIIEERELDKAWAQMLSSLRHAAELDPLVIVNGDPDGQMLPSHLAAQGFYLLRARTQLKEISNILLK